MKKKQAIEDYGKILPVLFFAVAAVVVGFYAFNSYIYNAKQSGGEIVKPYRATLTGEYVCLPHKDTSGPQTLECAFGMKTDVGEYYALDFNLMSQGPAELNVGDRFTATGNITPIEMLSTDHWDVYSIEGIFSVTDSVVKE